MVHMMIPNACEKQPFFISSEPQSIITCNKVTVQSKTKFVIKSPSCNRKRNYTVIATVE